MQPLKDDFLKHLKWNINRSFARVFYMCGMWYVVYGISIKLPFKTMIVCWQ